MRTKNRLIPMLVVTCSVMLACGKEAPPPVTPESTPAPASTHAPAHEARPTATTPDGASFTLEIATTQEEIARGMMFRPSFPEDHAMLFLFGTERMPSFWMKNTLIALDIVFLNRYGVVVDVVKMAQPCKMDPCPQYSPKRPAAAVLEFVGGTADRFGLAEGDRFTFENVPGYPESATR